MEEKNEELQTNFGATRWSIWAGGDWRRPGETMGPTLPTIFANCATCSWETLTMVNPQFVAGFAAMSPKTFGLFHLHYLR